MKRIVFWIGVAVSVGMLVLALRGLRLEEFGQDLSQANLVWLIPGILAYFLAVAVRAWRWQYMIRPLKSLPLRQIYPVVVIGYMGNNIYPARIGEFVRAYVLRRKADVPIAFTLSTVLLERVLDALIMAAFVLIGLPRVPGLPAWLHTGVYLAGVVFALATVAFFALGLAPGTATRLAEAVITKVAPARFRTTLSGFVSRFVAGASSMRRPIDLLALIASSALVWLIETVKYWCVAQGFGLTTGFVDLMMVNGVSNLFTIIPGPPGAVGTFDAGSILTLQALGVPQALASAYTVVLHVALWLPVTALGALFMLREGLHWSDLRTAEATRV